MFAVIENAVNHVFASRQVLWATVGGGLALWQVSGAVRAVMGALARIYGASGERSFLRRYAISFVLSIEIGACFTLTALCLLLAPFVSVDHPGAAWSVFAFFTWSTTAARLSTAAMLAAMTAPIVHTSWKHAVHHNTPGT